MEQTDKITQPKQQREQTEVHLRFPESRLRSAVCQPQHDQTDLTKLGDYGMYYLGALLAVKKVLEMILSPDWKNDEKPYREAILRLITKDKRSMQLYMDGCYDICFRNHKHDKKGKVTWAEAYFAERRIKYEEVR